MKRLLAILIAFSLMSSLALADSLIATGYETESVAREWETNLFFSRMTDLTGIEVIGHGIQDEKEYAVLLEKMQAGEQQADILFKANLTREQEEALLASGAILDLAPLIEDNMPNLSALLAAHPEWKEQIALEDGRIASLPLINEQERQICAWLNTAWLDSLGLKFPESLEELEQVLTAFTEKDPNGNGKKDEAALDLVGVYEMRWLLPLFGLVADDYNLCWTSDGTLAFAPDQPEYRTFIETLKRWYDLGLMRADAFTTTHAAIQLERTSNSSSSSSSQNTVNTSGLLVSITPYTNVDADEVQNYRALLLAGPDGTVRWRDLLGEIWNGTFAVTSRCADPAAALQWVDALYGEAGALLSYIGLEGEEYTWTEEGYWAYIAETSNEMEVIRSEKIIYTGITAPGLYPAAVIEKVDSAPDRWVFTESEKVRPVAERVLRNYYLPASIRQEATELAVKIGELVDVGIARFITGELPITEENYLAWLDSLHAAGSQKLTELLAGQ